MSFGVEVRGWFASAYVGKLVDKVCSYISDQYGYEANVKDKLKCLAEGLKKSQCLLLEADKRRIHNLSLQQWLCDLKDASYEVEDIVDMFEYKILEDKVEKTQNQVSSTSHRLIKRPRTVPERYLFSDDEVKGLNGVVDEFTKITGDMGHAVQLISLEPTIRENVHEIIRSRETTSLCTEPQLFGRNKERSYLIEQLLETYSSDSGECTSKNVSVLPIVGIGGVGKTILAQDVYRNEYVKRQFDLTAWVCVSDDFDLKRLAKEIIESSYIPTPQDFHNLQNLGSILEILEKGLAGKKFLIVLDDVWNEVARKWETLQAILNCGEKGSRIVVTTRSQMIADMMGTGKSITLRGLVEDDYWNFFVYCAYGDEDPKNYPSLELIGRQIAKKLEGNPLAAKTVGAVLKCDMNVPHWREVLHDGWSQFDQQEDEIMSVLRLSYDYLPVHLKQCFIYCSLFPQDYQYEVSKLVRLWMAQGFLQSEEIGLKYFDELFSRSFFQEANVSDRYVINDLLHDLARQLSDGEIFNVAENKPKEIPNRVRHLSVDAKSLSLACNNKYLQKNLRSLLVTGCSNYPLEMLKELRGIRVLILVGFEDKILSESFFGEMVHLRYLEIEGYEGEFLHTKLPKSIGMLYHIQVISVGSWRNDTIDGVLPEEIKRLVNLRHLDAGTGGVAGIGTLTLLQELHFRVKQRENGFEMGQLRQMSELRELEFLGLESVRNEQEAGQAMLEDKEHLKELRPSWVVQDDVDHNLDLVVNNEDVLDGLQPHRKLETLHIEYYSGRRSPHWWNECWVSCSYLQKIELSECSNWEVLPPFGLLPHLKHLELYKMNEVKCMGSEFYGSGNNNNSSMIVFPILEILVLWKMPELVEWWKVEEEGESGKFELFPCLTCLVVRGCSKLRGPLFLPSQLKVLTVEIGRSVDGPTKTGILLRCEDVSRLIEWVPLQNLASFEQLKFSDREMRRVPAELEEWFQHLTSLRSLSFEDCFKLESLPSDLLNSLSSTLHELSFRYCWNMESLPEGLPTSLRLLEIDGCCDELAKRCSKEDSGREWHKISHIATIRINGEHVQQRKQRIYGVLPEETRGVAGIGASTNNEQYSNDIIYGVLPEETRVVAGNETSTLNQELHFRVDVREDGFEMRQLGDMSELRELEISGLESVVSNQEACKAMLKNKVHLKCLTLVWAEDEEASEENYDQIVETASEVLQNLLPNSNLEEMTIRDYYGDRFPSWMGDPLFSKLISVTLDNCSECDALPPLGQLPSLKSLSIRMIDGVKCIGDEVCGSGSSRGFPSLEALKIWEMYELEELCILEDGNFPRLRKLCISRCNRLKRLPCFVSLAELSLHCCAQLPDLPSFPCLKLLKIEGIQELESLPHRQLDLPALHSLEISSCFQLSSMECLSQLVSLEKLKVLRCPNLHLSSDVQLSPMLQVVDIGCGCSFLSNWCPSGFLVNRKLVREN